MGRSCSECQGSMTLGSTSVWRSFALIPGVSRMMVGVLIASPKSFKGKVKSKDKWA